MARRAAVRGRAGRRPTGSAPVDLAVALLTYNNAETVDGAPSRSRAGGARAPAGRPGRPDRRRRRLVRRHPRAGGGRGRARPSWSTHEAPAGERVAVPFHGVPGPRARRCARRSPWPSGCGRARSCCWRPTSCRPRRRGSSGWRGPVLEDKADFVTAAYARHRYEGTISRLVLGPLVRALYGRRLHHPFGGQQALSARLVEHLLVHPKWSWTGADVSDLWIIGTAIADGFAVWEAWLGPHAVSSRTRTTDLPAMIAQTARRRLHRDGAPRAICGWRCAAASPCPAVGEPVPARRGADDGRRRAHAGGLPPGRRAT